jgi:uncharacterized membrane protein
MSRRRLLMLAACTLAVAAVVHVAVVRLVPIAVASVFMSRVTAAHGVNHVVATALPTDKARSVVKPSPDLLYAACVYDISAGPVYVLIDPPAGYWSLSLFSRNTDNYFTLDGVDVSGGRAELVIGSTEAAAQAQRDFPNATFVAAPGARGVMLARVLVLDSAHVAAELAAQHSVRCEALTKRT